MVGSQRPPVSSASRQNTFVTSFPSPCLCLWCISINSNYSKLPMTPVYLPGDWTGHLGSTPIPGAGLAPSADAYTPAFRPARLWLDLTFAMISCMNLGRVLTSQSSFFLCKKYCCQADTENV